MNFWFVGIGTMALILAWMLKRHQQALDHRQDVQALAMIPSDERGAWGWYQDRAICRRFDRSRRFGLHGWVIDPWRECSHPNVKRIYGDEIEAVGGKRNNCHNCGRVW